MNPSLQLLFVFLLIFFYPSFSVCPPLVIPLLPLQGLEFIYAQSPESMKGLLTGLYYFIIGAFSGVGSLIFYTTLLPGIWLLLPHNPGDVSHGTFPLYACDVVLP